MNGKFSKSKGASKSAGLPIIRCSCGSKILLVPSVKEMSRAIEAHVEEHKHKIVDPADAQEESERVRSDLIEQVFNLASRL